MTRKDKIRIAMLLVLWLVVFYPIYPDMVHTWLDHSDNSHAFLVPFIAFYFVWEKRHELATARLGSSAWGGGILAASLFVFVASYAGGIAFSARIAMVGALFGLVWFCLGNNFIRILAFPISFLFFMVPVPDSLISRVSLPLQLLATRLSAKMIESCSIPVYREGNMLYFIQTQLEVAEACSGIRSIVSLLMLSMIFCYFSRGGWWRKTLLVAATIPIAMTANVFRVMGTGILAHFYGDRVARGFLHQFSGLVIFAFSLAVMFLVHVLINRGRTEHVR